MPNPNHPKKGSIIKAEPLTSLEMTARVEQSLQSNPRNYAIFVLGINTNFRASDILRRTVGEVRNSSSGSQIIFREKKTKKVRKVTLNRKVAKALNAWLQVHPWSDDDAAALFPNIRTGQALTVSTLSQMVKQWCLSVGFKGHYSSHTMRKTFGYLHRTIHGTDLPTLMVMFNHTSQQQTLDYLCVDDEDIRDAYMKEV
jgi:integrase